VSKTAAREIKPTRIVPENRTDKGRASRTDVGGAVGSDNGRRIEFMVFLLNFKPNQGIALQNYTRTGRWAGTENARGRPETERSKPVNCPPVRTMDITPSLVPALAV